MRIATYNVFNLQLGGLTGAVAKSTRAIKSLVWSINEIESDVVLLQEVADDGVLDQINDALAKPYKVARVMPGNDVRGFHQALLAREDCQSLSVEDFVAGPMIANGADSVVGGYQRNLVFHHFSCSSGTQRIELAVVSLHLKSGYVHPHRSLPCSDVIRLCEVQDVIAWIKDWRERDEGKNAQVPVLIAGDLNESCDQSAVQHLIKSLDLVDLVEQDWVSRDRRPSYSWFTKSTKGRLDYLLADRASCALVVENSVRIHVSAAMRKASDHYPVTVDLAVDLIVS